MSHITNTKVAYGKSQGLIDIFNEPVVSLRSPTTNDKGSIGQLWVNKTTNQVWMLTSFVGGLAFWSELDNNNNTTGINWIATAANNIPMVNNTGYILTGAGTITLNLPIGAGSSAYGSQFYVIGNGNSDWRVACGAGQNIRLNGLISGGPGNISCPPGHLNATVHIVTTVADVRFNVLDTNDNLNIV